ncbi:MAG: protein TolQ [Rickettsiales bacterium]|nr:protein TolQ [Rickettsiales bacterium]
MTDSTNVSTAVDAVGAAEIAGNVAQSDMSAIGMFLQADFMVKAVMIGLLASSIWTWAIIIDKTMRFKSIKLRSAKFESDFWSADALDGFYEKVKRRANHPYAVIFMAAMEEWFRTTGKGNTRSRLTGAGVKERIAQIMGVARNRELDELEKGLGFLATVGSAAPFIGLFGTVWGIMNSFQNIAVSKNTSLAVVAPGIAEALLATAIGLFAAIPAVIAYNKFNGELNRLAGRMEDFSIEFEALLSRQTELAAAA